MAKKNAKVSSVGNFAGINKNSSNSKRFSNEDSINGVNTARTPIVNRKTAQWAGNGANVTFTQPMFFSPLHTPQNWQLASKRREIYQWSFITPCNITLYDFSVIPIDRIYEEKEQSNSSCIHLYPLKEKVIDGAGKPAIANIVSKRYVNKKANKISVMGVPDAVFVTHDHDCLIIKKKYLKCKYHKTKNCISECNSSTCERNNCTSYKGKEYNISKIKAENVEKGDYVLIPFSREIKEDSIIKDKFFAQYIGYVAADGYICDGNNTSGYQAVGFCFTHEDTGYVEECLKEVYKDYNISTSNYSNETETLLATRTSQHNLVSITKKCIVGKGNKKKFTDEVVYLDPKLQLYVLGAYIQADGDYNITNDCFNITCYSPNLANQLLIMFFRCGILARSNKQKISSSPKTFKTDNSHRYIISIPSSEVHKIVDYVPGKGKSYQGKKNNGQKRFFWKNYVIAPVTKNESFDYDGDVYDIQVPPSYTVNANGIGICQCRFYYENEPKIAAGIDFYSEFPMNNFKIECKNQKVLTFFEEVVKDLRLNYWLKMISHEYFMLGDVFPFTEISCEVCGGSGFKKDGTQCNHEGGNIKRIVLLNPDWIEVQKNVLADNPVIVLVPDEELRSVVEQREPRQIYEKLPERLINMIRSGQPIPLSNRCVSHLKYNASPYGVYGVPLTRRCFTVLAYKTKLMTANWIVAERMILPVRVVKVGDKDRPATASDILDVSNQLSAVANDPNLTLITHHAFDYEWFGPTGKIHNISNDLEYVGKEILDGLMLNQALLNGEASSYSSAQVGVEVLIRRLDSWRATLAEWVENHIFLPISMMQGFVDEEKSKALGETKYHVPTIKWNDLNLRDNSNHLQFMMQLHDKGLISRQRLLEEFDINPDQELERLRLESLTAGPQGQLNIGAGGMPGFGGLGGGMPGGDLGGMEMPPMPEGGEMIPGQVPGGAEIGGGGMDMGMGASTQLPSNFKVQKKGKGTKLSEIQAPRPKVIQLTNLEQKLYQILKAMDIPYQLYGQYEVKLAGNARSYLLDFAYPSLGIGLEADGKEWHEDLDAKARDQKRDTKLANVGWRILRFKEEALKQNPDGVKAVIQSQIAEAYKQYANRKKKAEIEGNRQFVKLAEKLATSSLSLEDIVVEKEAFNLGNIYYIGISDNEPIQS